jgi:two-component system LytT family sensor kinase
VVKSFLHKGTVVFYVFWWLLWTFIQWYILLKLGITETEAIVDSYTSNFLLGAACLLVINNMKYYLPKHEKYWYILAVSFVLSSVWFLVTRVVLGLIFKYDDHYIQMLTLQQSGVLRFGFAFLMMGCISTVSLLWYTQQDHLQADEQRKEIERLAKEAELFKLRQQLQPHFLFNSLNSISALTKSQPEKARHMIQQLSDFLRGTLKKEDHHWNSLKEELQYLELYLDIEKVRFGHRLQTEMLVQEDTLPLKIPALLLQPVVENAIKFGLYDTIGEVTISIETKRQEKNLMVAVTNPFDPETAQPLQGTGFGLPSIKRRLFLLFGRNDLLQTKQNNNYFTTIIHIPETV